MEAAVARLGWEKHKSKSHPGRFYYFNRKTGDKSWSIPTVPSSNNGEKRQQKESNLLKIKSDTGIGKTKNLAQKRLNALRENLEKNRQVAEKLEIPVPNRNTNLTKMSNPAVTSKNENQSRTSRKLNTHTFPDNNNDKGKDHKTEISTDLKFPKSVLDRLKNKTLQNAADNAKRTIPIKNKEKIVQNKLKSELTEEQVKVKIKNSQILEETSGRNSTDNEITKIDCDNKPNKEKSWLAKAVTSVISYANNIIKDKCNIINNDKKKTDKCKPCPKDSISPPAKLLYKTCSSQLVPPLKQPNFCYNASKSETQSKSVLDCIKENTNLETKGQTVCKGTDIENTKTVPQTYMTEFYRLLTEYKKPPSANERLLLYKNVIKTKNVDGNIQAKCSERFAVPLALEEDEPMLTDDDSDLDQPRLTDDVTPMEWEDIDEQIYTQIKEIREFSVEQSSQTIEKSYNIIEENLLKFSADANANRLLIQCNKFYIVIDTNIFLRNLAFLDELHKLKFQGSMETVLIVPYTVLQELDKLKHRKYDSVSRLASRAINYINQKFRALDELFKGQSAYEAKRNLINIESPDDSILNCCLQVKQFTEKVVLLSNDTNLRNKSICNNIQAVNKNDLLYKNIR